MQTYKWTVEFEVSSTWVEDGFNLTNERALNMLACSLPFAYNTEIKAKVLTKPTDSAIAKEQGYRSVAAWKKAK